MTIEQKAKAYDEALERYKAKQEYESKEIHKFIEYIFPELAESEDEKIRKALIKYYSFDKDGGSHALDNITPKQIVTWLEKQGDKVDAIEEFSTEFERQVSGLIASAINREHEYNEGFVKWNANALLNYAKHELEKQGKQKPANKVEPKFHEDDWVVSNLDGIARRISEVHFDEYNSYYVVDGNSVNLEEYDRLHHLWTIADAKDGDVLANNNGWVGVFNFLHSDDFTVYCFITRNMSFYSEFCVYDTLDPLFYHIHPATKEQRDLLFQKIKDAGYEWDAEKKELKKIENPTAWSEEDEKMFRSLHNLIYVVRDCDCDSMKKKRII